MADVAVITGGAGGMGLATAKVVGREKSLVLCDVRQDRLDAAAATLADLGISATVVNADVTDSAAVEGLFETAAGLGNIAAVIHTAGVSPSMGAADYVMRTNAVGTVNVNEAFFRTAAAGSAIVNVASMAAHILPEEFMPTAQFPVALADADRFMAEMSTVCEMAPEEARSGLAYAISKGFEAQLAVRPSENCRPHPLDARALCTHGIGGERGIWWAGQADLRDVVDERKGGDPDQPRCGGRRLGDRRFG